MLIAMRLALALLCATAAAPSLARADDVVQATLTCRLITVIDTVLDNCPDGSTEPRCIDDRSPPPLGADDEADKFHQTEVCEVRTRARPHGDATVTFHAAAAGDAAEVSLDRRFEPVDGSPADLRAAADLDPTPAPDCKPIDVDAAIHSGGVVVWTGHARYQPRCKRSPARLACTTPDGKPVRRGARLDQDLACTVTGDEAFPARVRVIAEVATPTGVRVVRRDPDAHGRVTFVAADLLPCARTTIRGGVRKNGVTGWTRALTITPSCPRPRP
jgi:hypothetical protein